MYSGRLVTGGVCFNDVPVEQRERLVEIGGAVEVRDEIVGQAAVTEPNGSVDQRNSGLGGLREAILVVVNERPGIDVRLPLLFRNVSDIDGFAAGQVNGRRESIYDLVVPLIEDGDSPITIGQAREGEGPISVALGEYKVLAVRISEADVALSEMALSFEPLL